LYPSEPSFKNASGGAFLIGNFTPTRVGIYSLRVNITDAYNNSEIRNYVYMINATGSDLVNYYFRSAYPTQGQAISYGSLTDAGSLSFEKPSSPEFRTCGGLIAFSVDVLPPYLFGIYKQINYSIWYKITATTSNYTGIERYSETSSIVDYNISVSATTQTLGTFNFSVDWVNDYFWTWYFMAIKLSAPGKSPYIYSNQTDPSYVNITYSYSNTPAIKGLTNGDILSATMDSNTSSNATIVLDGDGNTTLVIQMPDTSKSYLINYDGIGCGLNANCLINSNSAGLVNVTISLGSVHTLDILGDITPPQVTINSPTATTYTTSSILLNVTLNENGTCLSSTNAGGNNTSMESVDNPTFTKTASLTEGNHTVNFYCNDTSGNRNDTMNVSFTVDTTPPYISIISPENRTYTTQTIPINLTNSSDAAVVWWNNGTTNLTYTIPLDSTFSEGSHTIIAYANDSFGNLNQTNVSFSVAIPIAETPASSSGGGLPTYYPTESNLQQGYEIALATHFQIKFNLGGNLHTMKVNNLTNDSVNITISSEPITFILKANQTEKVDVNSDGYYDISIFLKSIRGGRANLTLTSISEVYGQINKPSINESDDELGNVTGSSEYSITAVGIIILLALVVLGIFLWVLKKRQSAQPIVYLSAVNRKLFGVRK
jgi:hypothetical protein